MINCLLSEYTYLLEEKKKKKKKSIFPYLLLLISHTAAAPHSEDSPCVHASNRQVSVGVACQASFQRRNKIRR